MLYLPCLVGDNMSLSKDELRSEVVRLRDTVKVIDDTLNSAGSDLFKEQDNLKNFQSYIWDNTQGFDDHEIDSLLSDNETKVKVLSDKAKAIRRLYKVRNHPYFGSFVFNSEPFYVGITSVKKDLDYLVCDWRAPISSLFYDYQSGKCKYESPDGMEEGILERKRQYRIENAKLQGVFETNMNIDDDMLQDVLAQNSSDKMKNIVNTIQAEQNQVIRDNSKSNIIVQGIAGSGKTSVALHRIAFLLYKLPYLTSGNVLIFSPNNVFTEYISNVLPDLGEDNTMQTTFHEFASTFISDYYRVEPYSSFVERYYKGVRQDNDLIKFKQSDMMKEVIEEFVKYYTRAARFTGSIEVNNKTIEMTELNDLLHDRYANKPLFERIELICEHLNNKYFKGNKKEYNSIHSKLYKIANFKQDYKAIYKALYDTALFNQYYKLPFRKIDNSKKLNDHVMPYEDATPYIYMKCLLEGYPYQVAMRQIVIDEAQDYSYLQYYLIRKIFKMADFTILGDVNQTVNPFYHYETLSILREIFGEDSKYIELDKTYRSSPEIIEYANQVLNLNHVSAIRRTQDLPVIKRDIHDLKHIGKDIKYLKDKYKSVAIITKSIDEANLIYEQFKDRYKKISVIDIDTKKYYTELVVTPAYGAKGLEFDAVIIVNNFSYDSYLYYVAVTRAQHELVVYE